MVQANQRAALAETPEAVNQVYNIACGEPVDLNEMTRVLKDELSRFDSSIENVEVIHGPELAGDIPHSQADISKAMDLLGYHPSHSFSDGIKETAEWYYKNLESI